MSLIFQQSKLKGCFWLLNKLSIITVVVLSIVLLMQDLMAEEQHSVWKLLPYAMLFILNSHLLIKTFTKTFEHEGTLVYWLITYAASMLINCVGIAFTNKYEYWIPVNSKTAAEFVIYSMDLDPVYLLSIAFTVTGIFCMIMTFALLVTVYVGTIEDLANPVLPLIDHLRVRPEPPPKYTSHERVPTYNTALQHEVVERA